MVELLRHALLLTEEAHAKPLSSVEAEALLADRQPLIARASELAGDGNVEPEARSLAMRILQLDARAMQTMSEEAADARAWLSGRDQPPGGRAAPVMTLAPAR